jgi:hypothetical protein
MDLYSKIIKLYPNLTDADFSPIDGTIVLQDDSDGNGVYIKSWHHPQYTQPTQEQLDGITL